MTHDELAERLKALAFEQGAAARAWSYGTAYFCRKLYDAETELHALADEARRLGADTAKPQR